MGRFLAILTPKGLLVATWAVLGLILLIALGLLYTPDEASLSVEARSQIFSVELGPNSSLPGVLTDGGGTSGSEECAETDQEFLLNEPLDVPVRAIFASGADGVLAVRLAPASEAPFGTFFCGDGETSVSRPISLIFADFDKSAGVIVAEGDVTIGEVPASRGGRIPLLLAGEVTAASSSYPLRTGRATETSALRMGDRLSFAAGDDGTPAKTWLTARRLPEDGAFDIIAQTEATSVLVNRLGESAAFEISRTPSVWSRLEAQSEWALLLLGIAILLNMLAALQHYMETRK